MHIGSSENYPAAIQTYEDMAKLGPDSQKRAELLLIDTYRESRDLDRAIAEAKKQLDASPKDPNLTVSLATLYGEKTDTDEATKLLEGLLRATTATRKFTSISRRCRNAESKYAEAEQSAQKAEQMAQGRRRQGNRVVHAWAPFTSGRRNSIRPSNNSAKCST